MLLGNNSTNISFLCKQYHFCKIIIEACFRIGQNGTQLFLRIGMKKRWKLNVYPNFSTITTPIEKVDIISFLMITISLGFRLHMSRYTILCPTI